ncbi:MAG: hypothetical protein KKB50_07695 [Planctomycetes bacterium]|nr:hypothetical protein [Planctomycetota bacterium]
MSRCSAGLSVLLLSVALGGCSQSVPASAYQSRVIESASVEEVFAAAQTLLRREFGRLTIDPEAYKIVTVPAEYRTVSDSGTARDLVGAPSRMRRSATLVVTKRGTEVVARLRVDLERQDTAQRAALEPAAGRLSDTPAYTPIERDAATTEQQNTVWTHVKRDRRLERALLEELRDELASTLPPENEAVPGAPVPAGEKKGNTP